MTGLTRRDVLRCGAAAGIAVATGTLARAQRVGPAEEPKDFWRAWSTTAGKQKTLTVEGIHRNGGPGVVAVLKPAQPQGFNPKILILKLELQTLPGVWPAIAIPIPACWKDAEYEKGRYTSVSVRYPDGTTAEIERIFDADEE